MLPVSGLTDTPSASGRLSPALFVGGLHSRPGPPESLGKLAAHLWIARRGHDGSGAGEASADSHGNLPGAGGGNSAGGSWRVLRGSGEIT